MRIFTRLLLLFLLVALLPLALLGYFNLKQNEAVLRAEALARVSILADKKMIQVKSYLAERERNMRFLAKSPRVIQGFDALSETYSHRSGAGYTREDALVRQYFDRYVAETDVFYDLFLITPQGEIIYSQKHESDYATNLLTGRWRGTPLAEVFLDASIALEPVISRQASYAPSDSAALFIAVPIMQDGKLKGVLAAQLSNELFYKVASDSVGLGVSGEAVFARKDGEDMLMTTPLRYRSGGTEVLRLNMNNYKTIPMFGALSGKSGDTVTRDYRGVEVVAAWRYLPELDWGMVVKLDADEVFASINRQRIIMLEAMLALLFFSGLLAYYFARQISSPLEGMARTADEVAGGALDKRADESAPGELGLFAQAFNRMTENLQALYRSLEDRVKERTFELNVANAHLQEEIIGREYTEAMLRERENYLRAIFETEPECVMVVGTEGQLKEMNAAGLAMLEADSLDEVQQRTVINFVLPEYRAAFAALHRRVMRGESGILEFEVTGLRGTRRWQETHAAPMRDANGSVTMLLGITRDITARKQAEEEIRNLAFYDVLTRLPNRRLLLDRMNLALSISQRSQHYGAVLFLDMDKFKTINDTLGHDYGDLLLIEVAQRIRLCVREVDTVARLGGDEFVVLIEEIDAHAAEASHKVALIAEKIRASLNVPYQLKDRQYHSSPSIGICLYRDNADTVDTLLKQADMAMYQAKESGRNTVRFFDPVMQHTVETHAELEADLRHAVPDGQLRLYYQIQVGENHQTLGAEALVRWIHPVRGMVSPAQFIPVAEESALILEIGSWVLETACRQLSDWRKNELTRNLSIAVNVSAQQFKLVDFVDKVTIVLKAYEIDASLLKLELTESVVLNDVADVVAKMHALKALGVQLSLDDFGTGYSSLSYLKRLPLDQIKIDQSFVRDITTDVNDAVMVHTIIDMAHNFGLNVIAEGVETQGQLAFLKLHGCMAYQGYLFSKPVPIDLFEKLLLN